MDKNTITSLKMELRRTASRKKADILQRFFKTGPGEYGEGDVFIGVKVPDIRAVAEKHACMELALVEELLTSPVHEERLAALLILVFKFRTSAPGERAKIFGTYLKNTAYINNWDLVDLSASQIAGGYLADKNKSVLFGLARSKSLWERRIAIVSTFRFIKANHFSSTFRVARMLLQDKEDLIRKAVGWMLRETGKRDIYAEEKFLRKYYKKMPRTMLRYAIERFPERKRLAYLMSKI